MPSVTFSMENSGVQSISFYRILYGFGPLISSGFLGISPVDWAGYKHGKDREKHKGKYLELVGIFLDVQSPENEDKTSSLWCRERFHGIS